ncbi:unnamed protein product [Rhodiola kirilowii]
MIFIRHHLHEGLKYEYLTIKDPSILWKELKERITSQMKLCGDKITDKEMLEKTFSTFHASNMVLLQQYRERGFTKYAELISCLLVAEQNNELLMKNHHSRPTGSTLLKQMLYLAMTMGVISNMDVDAVINTDVVVGETLEVIVVTIPNIPQTSRIRHTTP